MPFSTSNSKIRQIDPYWIVFSAFCVFTLIILWTNTFLPLMDLPEHVAQVSIARHFNDPATAYSANYYFDWMTPYLTGILCASALSFLIGVLPAVKVVLSLSIIGLPLSLLYLIRRTRGDRWLSLAGFPLGFGYNYVLGHFNYMVAMPLSILLLAMAVEIDESFSLKRMICLYLFSWVLWFSHGYLYAVTIVIAAPFFLAPAEKRAWLTKMGAYALMVALPITWWILINGTEINYRNESLFDFSPLKLAVLPNYLLSENIRPFTLIHALGFLLVVLMKSRPTLNRTHWLPLITLLLGYYFLPYNIRGAAHFGFQRISFLAIPALLITLSYSKVKLTEWTFPHLLLIGLCSSWLGISYVRAHAFDQEGRAMETIAQKIEPHKRVFPLLFRQTSSHADGRPYRYFSAYLTEMRGADLNFSFAMQPPQWIRKRMDLSTYKIRRDWHWDPSTFLWKENPDYDYYLVHWPSDLSGRLFQEAGHRVREIAHEGNWWLYQSVPAFNTN